MEDEVVTEVDVVEDVVVSVPVEVVEVEELPRSSSSLTDTLVSLSPRSVYLLSYSQSFAIDCWFRG